MIYDHFLSIATESRIIIQLVYPLYHIFIEDYVHGSLYVEQFNTPKVEINGISVFLLDYYFLDTFFPELVVVPHPLMDLVAVVPFCLEHLEPFIRFHDVVVELKI